VWSDRPRDAEGVELNDARRTTAGPARRPDDRQPAQSGADPVAVANANSVGAGGVEACYVPGTQAIDYRSYQAGKLLPAGVDIEFRLHYTPDGKGKDVLDRTDLGFTVSDTPPP